MPGPTQEADPRPFECSICQARFRTKINRKHHIIVVHENAGTFRCTYCDKSFSTRANLERHERAHRGERPFQCKICKRALTTNYYLKDHHLKFHSEKKFRCEVCDKLFGMKNQLRLHLQCHSSERFECDQCGLSYQHKTKLYWHQARQHLATKREAPTARATKRKTPGRLQLLAGSKDKESALKVVLSDCRNGSPGVTYNLRTRGNTANYRDEQADVEFDEENESRSSENGLKSGDNLQDGVDETSEPDQTAIGNDEEQNDLTENDRDISEVPHGMREPVQDASRMIILSSDDEDEEEGGQDDELAMETSTLSNATLKLVYDVEYRAPE